MRWLGLSAGAVQGIEHALGRGEPVVVRRVGGDWQIASGERIFRSLMPSAEEPVAVLRLAGFQVGQESPDGSRPVLGPAADG